MGDSSSKDLIYRVVSVAAGDGFTKTAKDVDEAKAKLDELGRKIDEEDHKEVTVRVRVENNDEDKLKDAGRDADEAGNEFSGMSGKMALVAVGAAAIAPVLAALPAAFGGIAAGAGVMALGLGGLISTVRDYGQAVEAPGISGAQMAATLFSNAVAIRNAQQAIAQARQQANNQAASSADSLTSAEERLRTAEQSALYAEQDLTTARQDAARSLIQANEAAATAALDVRAAQLAVVEAQHQQLLTNQALTSTALDRQKAELAVEQAQNSLIDVTERAREAQQDAAKANAKGVEGSQQVVQAKRAEAQAQQGVGDAQRQLAATQRQIAEQQVSSQQQIAKAVQNLADTQRQQQLQMAATQAQASAGMAQFGRDMAKLTPVMQEAAREIIGMRGEYDRLRATTQNAIGPGVLVFLSGLQQMGPTANNALQQMGVAIGGIFTQLGTLMKSPVFQQNLGAVFKDAAGFVAAFGQGFVQMVSGLAAAGAKAGPIVAGLGDGFKTLAGSGIPAFFQGLAVNASGAGQTLSSILGLVSGLLGPLGTLSGAISGALGPAFKILAPIVSQVATQVVNALLPYMPQLSQAFVQIALAIGQVAPLLAPLIGMMAGDFVQTLQVVVPLIGQLADFFNKNQQWLVPLIGAVVIMVSTFKTLTAIVEIAKGVWLAFNLILDANPIFLIIAAIAGLAAGVIYAWNHFAGFRDFIKQAWADIKQWFDDAVKWIKQAWDWIVEIHVRAWELVKSGFDAFLGFVKQWWPELLAPFTAGISLIVGHWNDIVTFFSGLPGRIGHAVAGIWDWLGIDSIIKTIFAKFDQLYNAVTGLPGKFANGVVGLWDWLGAGLKWAVNGVIGGFNWVIDQINTVTQGLSDTWSWAGIPSIGHIDHVPQMAAGGEVVKAGLAVVGEQGAELVRLGAGAQVTSNRDSRALFGASQQQPTPPFYGTINLQLNGKDIDTIVVTHQRNGGVMQSIRTGALAALGTAAR